MSAQERNGRRWWHAVLGTVVVLPLIWLSWPSAHELALLEARAGEADEARAVLLEQLSLDPDDGRAARDLLALPGSSREREVLQAVAFCSRHRPLDHELREWVVDRLILARYLREATALARYGPPGSGRERRLFDLALAQGRLEEALDHARALLRYQPETSLERRLAGILERLGRFAEAAEIREHLWRQQALLIDLVAVHRLARLDADLALLGQAVEQLDHDRYREGLDLPTLEDLADSCLRLDRGQVAARVRQTIRLRSETNDTGAEQTPGGTGPGTAAVARPAQAPNPASRPGFEPP